MNALYLVLGLRSASIPKDSHQITTSERGIVVCNAKERCRLGIQNSGLPTVRNRHGNGFAIVGVIKLQVIERINCRRYSEARKSGDSPKPQAHVGQGSLGELITYDSNGKCNNAYNVVCDVTALQTAYMMIKSEPGNMTPGTDGETLDGITED